MMALTAEQTAKAQAEAREFLEYSILTLCSMLGIIVGDLGETYDVPVAEDHPDHGAHSALKRQVEALALLP